MPQFSLLFLLALGAVQCAAIVLAWAVHALCWQVRKIDLLVGLGGLLGFGF